jgi:hypothetical protein
MLQFLQWVADRPRSREDVMGVESSCPRFRCGRTRADGLIQQRGGEAGQHRVELAARGRDALPARRRDSKFDGQPAIKGSAPNLLVPAPLKPH